MAEKADTTGPGAHRQRETAKLNASPAGMSWLQGSARKIKADSALLLIRQGENYKVVGAYPAKQAPDRTLFAGAKKAFAEKHVIERITLDEVEGKSTAPVKLAFAMRLGGRLAAVAFQVNAQTKISDKAILQSVGNQVLRRADDSVPMDRTVSPSTEADSNLLAQLTEKSSQQADLIAEQSTVLEPLAMVLDQEALDPSLHAMANGIAQTHRCQQSGIA